MNDFTKEEILIALDNMNDSCVIAYLLSKRRIKADDVRGAREVLIGLVMEIEKITDELYERLL